MGDPNSNNNPTQLGRWAIDNGAYGQTYYQRRAAGVCPDCERSSGIWIYCPRCRRRHRDRVARYNALYPRPSHRRK